MQGNPSIEVREMKKNGKVNSAAQSKADPLGSYTGKCVQPKEKPVQDADDL